MTETVFDPVELAGEVARLGDEVSPPVLAASQALYLPWQETEPYDGVRVTRDRSYGTDPRQRLDVFAPEAASSPRPVLVFVHGGSFTGGDKHRPGSPYHDNVGVWAVRNGAVGVTVTYRLAPSSTWPSGAEDIARAVAWVRDHADDIGGDRDRVHVLGTSAGAVHVASYLTGDRFHGEAGHGVASAIHVSGAYDLPRFDHERLAPYLGTDVERYREALDLDRLVALPIPQLFVVAEHDPRAAQEQAMLAVAAYLRRHDRWPDLLRLPGHNHFTATAHLNTPDQTLACALRRVLGLRSVAPGASGPAAPTRPDPRKEEVL